MTLHDLITLMILLIGTSGYNEIQYIIYISEYILKLQIHQHLRLPFILCTSTFIFVLNKLPNQSSPHLPSIRCNIVLL